MTDSQTGPAVGAINYRNPTLLGILASALLTILVVVGSRYLEHFDPALFGYTVASIVAIGAIVFRYALWLQRPATRAYFWRGLDLFFRRGKIASSAGSAVGSIATNLVEQRFIFKRGFMRWLMHFLIMWGCILSAAITFPLSFGWVHFKLEGDRGYRAYLFRIRYARRASRAKHFGVATISRADFTAAMVIAGCAIAIHRRLKDATAINWWYYTRKGAERPS